MRGIMKGSSDAKQAEVIKNQVVEIVQKVNEVRISLEWFFVGNDGWGYGPKAGKRQDPGRE